MSGAAERGWIGGKGWDLAFFFGGSALAAAAGAAFLAEPALVVPAWWAWLLLVDGPHLFATWTRSYLDPADRAKLGRTLLSSLWTLLPGLLAWAILATTGERTAFDLFLLAATLWAYFHAIRQQYGILAIYHRHDATPPVFRRLDVWFLQGALWAMYALLMFGHPASREAMRLPRELTGAAWIAAIATLAVLGAAMLLYVASMGIRASRGIRLRPAFFVLLPVVALQGFAVLVIGAREPLYAGAAHVEQVFLAAAVVGGLLHGIQYLGIVFAANRRRYASMGTGVAAALGRHPARAYLAFVALALGYLALNAVREGSPAPSSIATAPMPSALFLAIYWGLFFHHYWLDQYLWRVSRDASLRAELGLT